jgi:hypothetical protein
VVPAPDDRRAFLVVNGRTEQSWVDPYDPLRLEFEYVQRIAEVLEETVLARPAHERLRLIHVGGGGLTLPRYVAATRPGSAQVVLEPDAALTAAVRARLPLPRGSRIRVRAVDGRSGLAALRDASADVVVLDAYAAGRLPAELGTVEAMSEMARVLTATGTLLANLADGPGLPHAGRVIAGAVAAGLTPRVVLGMHEVLKGRRFGNYVLAASAEPVDLVAVGRRVARSPFPTAIWDEAELSRRTASTRPMSDDSAEAGPVPPTTWLTSRRRR